jgi:hypothetical protein
MLLLPCGRPPCGVRGSNPLGAVAPCHEVTDTFTTALPMYVAAHRQLQRARWRTGDIG